MVSLLFCTKDRWGCIPSAPRPPSSTLWCAVGATTTVLSPNAGSPLVLPMRVQTMVATLACRAPPTCSQPQLDRLNGPERSLATAPGRLPRPPLLYARLPLCFSCALCALLESTLASQCQQHAWAPVSHTLIAHSDCRISGPSKCLPAAARGRALLPRCLMLCLHYSPLLSSPVLVCLLLESTLVSQCRHNAMAPGSRTVVAGPSERLLVTSAMHNAVGASPWTCPIVSGLPSRRTRMALRAPLSPSSSRVGSAYGIRRASYHPQGFYTGARSPGRVCVGGFPRWGGLRATHYYHMHTSRGNVCLRRVWGSCWWLLSSRGCRWVGVSTVVVVILHFTTNDVCILLLIWRSKHGWFGEREACRKKPRRRWRHSPNTTIAQNPGGRGGGGGLGGVAYKDPPPPPP